MVRTSPPRSKIPNAMALSPPPVLVIRFARMCLCMLRDFPPIKALVRFDFSATSAQLHERVILHRQSDAMQHEPCRSFG